MDVALLPQGEEVGVVIGINVSRARGTKKTPVVRATLIADHGIQGDAHAGPGYRQVSLLGTESLQKMRALGVDVNPGDFAENVTVGGLAVTALSVGDRVRLGPIVLEVTQVGKVCHQRCAIYEAVGDCVMPREGIFARVIVGGELEVSAPVRVERAATRSE